MHYAEIKYFDIANGPGIRLSLFVSGCTHHCEGCFNAIAWDFSYGRDFTEETEESILETLADPAYQGMTILGGEPMEPENQKGIVSLCRKFKERFPEKDLWIYTGYLYDADICGRMMESVPETKEILTYTDVIVDGRFAAAEKDITLLYKGSRNQRTIDVRRSSMTGKLCLWDPGKGLTVSDTAHL